MPETFYSVHFPVDQETCGMCLTAVADPTLSRSGAGPAAGPADRPQEDLPGPARLHRYRATGAQTCTHTLVHSHTHTHMHTCTRTHTQTNI